MIFVATVTMIKRASDGIRVRASTLVAINAKSEQEANGRLLNSEDVVRRVNDDWWIGEPVASPLSPEGLLEDADLAISLIRMRTKQEKPSIVQAAKNADSGGTTE